MNLTAAQNDALATVLAENDVAAWDGARLRKLIELIMKLAPFIMPLVLDANPKAANVAASGGDDDLGATDWKAIFDLILKLLPLILSWLTPAPTPAPEPSPGPVA